MVKNSMLIQRIHNYMFISIKPIDQHAVDIRVAKLENCLTDIYAWMSENKRKLNAD